jgi:uncharacterized protein
MKIGITGASGFVGTRLIDGANRIAHHVVGFSRNPKRRIPGCIEMRKFSLDEPIDIGGCEAIVHLAGESIVGLWTDAKKRRIRQSRLLGTRQVVDAIAAAATRPRVLISASGIAYYGDTGESEVDESGPPGKGFLAEVAQSWEQEALRAEEYGVRVVLLRLGVVLGRHGGVMAFMRPIFKLGLGGTLGSGRQWMSWVHVSDVAGMILYSLETQSLRGPVNCTAPNPCRNADFTRSLATKFHRPAFLHVPEWLLKKTLGELSDMLLTSQRVLPKRAIEAGYVFHYIKL